MLDAHRVLVIGGRDDDGNHEPRHESTTEVLTRPGHAIVTVWMRGCAAARAVCRVLVIGGHEGATGLASHDGNPRHRRDDIRARTYDVHGVCKLSLVLSWWSVAATAAVR